MKKIAILSILLIMICLVGCNKPPSNNYKEFNIDNYFVFEAPSEMVKTKIARDEPSVGMYKSDSIALIYEYGDSSHNLASLKMYSDKPNFIMLEKQINNRRAIIFQYHWGILAAWKQRAVDLNFSSELSAFRYCSILHFPKTGNEDTTLTLFIYSNGNRNDVIDHIINSINFSQSDKALTNNEQKK